MPKSLQGIEIFSAGEWNGDEYTVSDLLEMETAFIENIKGLRPYIKIGHDPKQKVLKELIPSDGMPSAGWVERIYVRGKKLMADFSDIPDKIFDLIEKKAYRKVSSEIFWNIKIGDKTYKRMLGAVALLGADTPGVFDLADILGMYKAKEGTYDKLSIDNEAEFKLGEMPTTTQEGEMPKTENEIKLEYTLSQKDVELKAKEDAFAALEKSKLDGEKEIADLKKFKADAEARESKLTADAETAKIATFISELKADKLCTPAMVPLMSELLGPEKKEYSIKTHDKEQKMSKTEIVKELLKLFNAAKEVNFVESSSFGKKEDVNNDAEIDKKAKAFMAENKCDYAKALKAVLKETKK